MKKGDYVIITARGSGTSKKDIGLFCQIVRTDHVHGWCSYYNIEIDRDKVGNRDRYLAENVLRLATPEEIFQNVKQPNYEIY